MPTRPPRIFDCFTYNGERDLLRLRMETLRGVVHRAVIAEATRTFTGRAKALRYEPAHLPDGSPPVTYLPVDDLAAEPVSAWDNENRQRNALARFLSDVRVPGGVHDEDWVMLSDVDEIPDPRRIVDFRPGLFASAVLLQRNFFYAFNNLAVDDDGRAVPWDRARVTTAGHLRRWFGSMQRLRDFRGHGALRSVSRAVNKLRTQRIADAGWHFSYLMTPEQVVEKLASFSHQEFNTREIANVDYIRRRMAQGRDLFSERRFRVVPLDATFPEPLLRDSGRYAPFVW